MHTDAQQSNRTPSSFGFVQQGHRAAPDVFIVARWRLAVAPRDGREVAVADFDRHRPRVELPPDEPRSRMTGHLRDLLLNHRQVGQVALERVLAP
jgi:hypothetical protein